MKKIEDKFSIFYFDNEMGKLNLKIEGLENRVNEKIKGLENRVKEKIEGLEKRVNARFDSLEGLMHKIAKKLNINVDE